MMSWRFAILMLLPLALGCADDAADDQVEEPTDSEVADLVGPAHWYECVDAAFWGTDPRHQSSFLNRIEVGVGAAKLLLTNLALDTNGAPPDIGVLLPASVYPPAKQTFPVSEGVVGYDGFAKLGKASWMDPISGYTVALSSAIRDGAAAGAVWVYPKGWPAPILRAEYKCSAKPGRLAPSLAKNAELECTAYPQAVESEKTSVALREIRVRQTATSQASFAGETERLTVVGFLKVDRKVTKLAFGSATSFSRSTSRIRAKWGSTSLSVDYTGGLVYRGKVVHGGNTFPVSCNDRAMLAQETSAPVTATGRTE
jgi:hypothetical protein